MVQVISAKHALTLSIDLNSSTLRARIPGASPAALPPRAPLSSARGGIYPAFSPPAALYQESYLTGLLAFLGFTDITIVRPEGIALGLYARAAAVASALHQIAALAA